MTSKVCEGGTRTIESSSSTTPEPATVDAERKSESANRPDHAPSKSVVPVTSTASPQIALVSPSRRSISQASGGSDSSRLQVKFWPPVCTLLLLGFTKDALQGIADRLARIAIALARTLDGIDDAGADRTKPLAGIDRKATETHAA